MKYRIYEEGYEATGESGKAHFLGESEGQDFLDACKNYVAATGYGEIYTFRGGQERPGNWGCFWYPTLEEARKYFG